jgi:hypothetical protein
VLSKILNWLDPDRDFIFLQNQQRYQFEVLCRFASSDLKVAETLAERVKLGEWTTEYMSEMLRLLPCDRYVVVRDAIQTILDQRGDRLS